MTLLIGSLFLTILSVGISYFLTERSGWRKIALLFAIVGAILSFVQGYRNHQRVGDLQNTLGVLSEKNTKLQQQAMSRRLRGDQKRSFTTTLSSEAGQNIVIVSAVLDHEAEDFADDFVGAFTDGKWTVGPRVKNWIRPVDGVTIGRVDEKSLPGENVLDTALTSANIKHSIKQIKGDDTRATSPWFTSGTLYLLIGTKPRAETE